MRRVSYKSVLALASQLWTGESDPSTEDAATLNLFINRRASQFWEHFYWPELCRNERRQFRPDYSSATTYGASTATAAVERYYPPSGKYYQSLVAANLAHVPAIAGTLAENSAYWAESADAYTADDYDDDRTYTRGERARNPDNGRFYQLHAATSLGTVTTDPAKWGILTPFIRNIDMEQTGETAIGEVKAVWNQDPYVYQESERCRLNFTLSDLGVIVRGTDTVVYPEFRLRVPSWTGEAYDVTTTYAALDQAYDDTEGDYFFSIAGTNLAQAVTDTTKWTRIEFPYVLRDAVAQAAYADMLRTDGQNEKYLVELAESQRLLDREIVKIELKQGQSRPLNVRSR